MHYSTFVFLFCDLRPPNFKPARLVRAGLFSAAEFVVLDEIVPYSQVLRARLLWLEFHAVVVDVNAWGVQVSMQHLLAISEAPSSEHSFLDSRSNASYGVFEQKRKHPD